MTSELKARMTDWLNAFKADPFSTGADKVDRLFEVLAEYRPPVPDKQLTDVVERLKNSLTCKGARLNDGDWTTLQARDVRAIIDAMDAISRCGISASDQAASA
jgi:hypothetical protein